MSTTVTYKGNTVATVSNATGTLKTAGKYMEGDVILTDVTSSGEVPHVWQDQDGYVHLDDEGTAPTGDGLAYETGTWNPSEDTLTTTINFLNAHTSAPMYVLLQDVSNTQQTTASSILAWEIANLDDTFGRITSSYHGFYTYAYRTSAGNSVTCSGISDASSPMSSHVTSSSFTASPSSSRYWRTGRTYEWIAIWAPAT